MKSIEKPLERRLFSVVKSKGGRALKFVSPGNRGVTDRIVLMPGAWIDFVELKDTGVEPEPLQLYWHKVLRLMGFRVYVIDTFDKLNKYLNDLPAV